MTRGRIKLKYKGRSDIQLTGNPKICFWKYVYKQHTNFAKQSNQIDYEDTNYMTNTKSSVFKFRILRNAELVKFISLKLKLPRIYSPDGHLGEFAWIKNIGANIIESARLYYDDILIEEIDGDFLVTHRDLLLNSDKTANFNKLIGNVPALYDPYQNNIYPSHNTTIGDLSGGTDFYINKGYSTGSSIKEYLLNIPLLFCFFREKSFIPLVSNKLREVFVEIRLRPLKELYTIIEQTNIKLNSPIKPSRFFLLEDDDYSNQTLPAILNEFPYGRIEPGDNADTRRWIRTGKDDQVFDDASGHDLSGYSMSINAAGTRVAVGIFSTNVPNHTAASVKVYELQNGCWTLLGAAIQMTEGTTGVEYSVSLNSVGDRLAIGIPTSDADAGAVLVYYYEMLEGWVPLQAQHDSLGSVLLTDTSGELVGYSVSLNASGDRIAIGTPGASNKTGLAQVYEYEPPTTFAWLDRVVIDGFAGAFAGHSVSFNLLGDRVAIGMPGTPATPIVRIYELQDPSGWVQLGGAITDDNVDWRTGWSVSMNSLGDRVAVATRSRGQTSAIEHSGLVRVYEYNSGAWDKLGGDNMESSGVYASLDLVSAVSLNGVGDIVAIGRPYSNLGGKSGIVQIYKYVNNNWSLLGTQSDMGGNVGGDAAGTAVSLSSAGNRVVIGLPGGEAGHGITRVYQLVGSAPNEIWTQLGGDISGGAAHDGFGSAAGTDVSINYYGDVIAVGMPRSMDLSGLPLTGSVSVYEYNISGELWDKLGNDMYGPMSNNLAGFSVELNGDGRMVVIGAPNYNGSSTTSGLVTTYRFVGNSWEETGDPTNLSGGSGGHAGWSVSTNYVGNIIASGVKYSSDTSGAVHIYSIRGSNNGWTQVGTDISGTADGDCAGWSVSLNASGDKVAVGMPGWKDGLSNLKGLVQLYEWDTSWNQLGEDISGSSVDDNVGWSVSLNASGNRVAIGSPNSTTGLGPRAGSVQLYELQDPSGWIQLGADISGNAAGDGTGWSVSLNALGNRVAVGSPHRSIVDDISGGATVYEYITANASGDWFKLGGIDNMTGYVNNDVIGHSVALNASGDRVGVGIPHISNPGFVRVYELWSQPIPEDYIVDTVAYKKRVVDANENIFEFTKNIGEKYFVPNLEVEYIFLDNVERKKFALENLSQTFTFNKKLTFNNITGTKKLYIKEFHPVKSLHVISKRDDIGNTNEWSNFSNNDYENQNVRYLQNNFTNIAQKEALEQGDTNFIKHLGAFMKTKNPFNCIIEEGRLSDISGKFLQLAGLDFLTSKPNLSLENNEGVTYEILYDMLVKYLLITNGGRHYIKPPRLVDNNNRIINSEIRLNNGAIESIHIRDKLIYDDYMQFSIEPQLYCNRIEIGNPGCNYTSLPSIYIKGEDRFEELKYTGKIKNGRIVECSLLDNVIVTNKGSVFVGGGLQHITSNSLHDIPDDLTIKFYDPYNKIIEPSIKIEKNQVKILDEGKGLSQHTKVCVGKIISKINFSENIRLRENIFDYEIVPVFYPSKSKNVKPNMRYSKKPQLDIEYEPINNYDLDYTIYFNKAPPIHADIIKFGKTISNKRLPVSIDSAALTKAPHTRDLFMIFYTTYGTTSINLGNFNSIHNLSTKIVHNLKTDITNEFNTFEIEKIKCGETSNDYITIHGHKTFRELNIKNKDVLTLFINEKEISTVTINEFGDNLIGLDNNTPNFKEIENHNNKLLFGNFMPGIYGLEFGKTITKIELNNIENLNTLALSNNNGFTIDLDKLKHTELKKPTAKILENIEYDYGGGKRALHEYLSYEIVNGFLVGVSFNDNYYLCDYTWQGYSKSPVFVLKNATSKDPRRQTREKLDIDLSLILDDSFDDNFQDALIEGIIDYGGRNFKGKIVDDNPGFNGDIQLDKITSNTYKVNFADLGYNYDEGLLCTLISYRIVDDKLFDLNILDQYDVKVNSIGQIDSNKQVLWKNETPISEIEIIWDKNSAAHTHTVYNPSHNINTQYKLILGNIPATDIIVINKGDGFSQKNKLMLYKTTCERVLFNIDFNYFTNIENGSIVHLSTDISRINEYRIPLVGYSITKNQLHINKVDYFIETSKQLTGFKIIDKGYNLNDEGTLYNGFITKIPAIDDNISSAYFKIGETEYPLDIKDNTLEIRDENKFTITNQNYNYSILDYKNVKIDNKIKSNTVCPTNFLSQLLEINVIDKTNTTTIIELEEGLPIFTEQSEVFFSSRLQDIKIIYPGNELDDAYSLYKLIFRNTNNEVINVYDNILLEFEGRNSIIRENSFDIDIFRDGGGYGAAVDPFFMEGVGCKLLSIMAVNESKLEKCLPEYEGNELNLNIDNGVLGSELRHLCQNIYGWASIDRSQLITQKDTLEIDNIRQFMDTWKYRDPMNIPILNRDNYNFYTTTNPIKNMGLSIDFKEREAMREVDFYRYLEKYFTMKNAVDSNILLYSFCLDNNRLQPNGSINLSSLDNLCIDLELKDPVKETDGKEQYKYNVSVFLKYYNVIDYINGAGSLKYAN